MNPFQLTDTAEKGVSVSLFEPLVQQSGYSKAAIADFIRIDVRTISNYKNKHLTKTDAEHLLKLSDLFEKGNEVFGTTEEFVPWLGKPAYGLDNRTPERLLHYISGIELINRE